MGFNWKWHISYRHATITKTSYNRQIQSQNTKVAPHCCCHSKRSAIQKVYVCYWQHRPPMLLVNSLNWSIFVYLQMSILWEMWVATRTSLPNPRRSHRSHCHPGQQYHVHILCIWVLYKIVTYFSVFKLRFTLRAPASAEAPESPTLLDSRLWKRALGN